MIRLILAGLAVFLAALAFITGQSWLYAAAGGTGGVALGLVVYRLRMQRQSSRPDTAEQTDDPAALGISPVRPMTPPDEEGDGSSASNGTEASVAASQAVEEQHEPSAADATASSDTDTTDTQEADVPKPTQDDAARPPSTASEAEQEGDPRVVAFACALRHALHAHTVALLVQEEMALEYRIAGLDSGSSAVQRSGTFASPHPLLTARMSHADVTVRDLEEEPRLREALNYYPDGYASALQNVALAPIRHAQQSATYFLIADGDANAPLQHKHSKRLLAQGADMLGRLLAYDPTGLRPPVASSETNHADSQATDQQTGTRSSTSAPDSAESSSVSEEMVDVTTSSPDVERQGPRPRIEIIAEEMEVARATDIPLALALVHLNRADMIAERGQDAVQQVEDLLQEALEEAAPHQRVERFGELTYGVFYQADLDTVEAWTLDLHRGMLRATGSLKGGVSVGVGMMSPRHKTASDFRGEVMRALHESYKSGAPVIID